MLSLTKHAFDKLGVERALIHQCALGAPSTKPAELALVNLPEMATEARSIRCPGRRHLHQSLMGRNADGRFRTAVAKEYPPGMCAWLAAGLHNFMAAKVGHLARCDAASLWDGLAAMGISHLFHAP